MDQQKIGTFIASLRKESGMTQAELGDKVGVTDRAVSRWENGHNLPDIMVMEKISEVFGITLIELMNGQKTEVIKECNLDKLAENAITYHKSMMRAYFKRLIIGLSIVIGVLVIILLTAFCINNFNRCKVYRIESTKSDFFVKGKVTQTNKSTTLVLTNFDYNGTKMQQVYAMHYSLLVDGNSIYHGGIDLDEFKIDKNTKILNIDDYFKTLTIYIDEFKNDEIFDSKDICIEFKYLSVGGEEYYYDVPLKLTKEFSNSKFIYFN